MEHTLNGGPSVSDRNWWVISISQQVVNEFPGMWAKPTCGLDDEGNKIDVWISVKFVLFRSMGHIPGFVLAAETRDGLQEKGATIETSKYVIEPLRLKTSPSERVQSVR